MNASLGPQSPTSFDPGLYRQREVGINFDVSRALSERLNVALGAEWRREQFEVGLGQPESWRRGPYVEQGFSVGSNGFPGFGPIAAGQWDRANYAVYTDVELRGAGRDWVVGAAGRVEDFDDFGATLNGKLAARWPLSEQTALRGSVSSGFRAPTPGQQNAYNVSTQWDPTRMDLFDNGTIPSTSLVAQRRGGLPLDAERSVHYSVGVAADSGPLQLTADYFHIDLSRRLTLSRLFSLGPAEVAELVAEGITSAANLASFRFFTNDLETRTQGVDVVGAWTPPAAGGATVLRVAWNYTDTAVTHYNPELLSPDDISFRVKLLEDALPATRWNVALNQQFGRLGLLARLNYFGDWYDLVSGYTYAGRPIVDLEGSWALSDAVAVAVGAQNVLNTYPAENPDSHFLGNRYPASAPFGISGGFYYARLNYSWNSR